MKVRRTGIDATLERLRSMILSGEIPPGTVISQTTLAKQLDVSTTPLREVMRQLQSEGLLEAEFNRRPRVPALDIDDLHAVYATRILLESLAITLTIDVLDDAGAQEISEYVAEMRRQAKPSTLAAWESVHARFHRRLVAGATPTMAPVIASFSDRAERYRRLSVMRDQPRGWTVADQEHERIVQACCDRDAQSAVNELAAHLGRTAISLSAAFAPEVDPRPVRQAIALVTRTESPPGSRRRR